MAAAGPGIHLVRTDENVAEVDALAELLGGRVGLDVLLGDLDRRGRRTLAPGRAVHRAWTWDRHDRRDPRWWPQGVSTSADADDPAVAGRQLVLVAWYAKELPGDPAGHQGSRVTVLDLASRRYRHVLLVVPVLRDGAVHLEPLRVHAGGIAWVGPHLHVAATARGLVTCRLSDLLRVPDDLSGSRRRLGVHDGRVSTYGYRYVLPVRFAYRARADEGLERLRYSFLSLDGSTSPPSLVAGEYGNARQTRRLARFPLEPGTGLLATDDDGSTRPLALEEEGVVRMQGVAARDETYYVTTSHGPWVPGSVHVGRPGAWRRHRWAVPMGPEDIAWGPGHDTLWSTTEHPRRRWVVALRRSWFDRRNGAGPAG
ncbi:hypothetical protein [Nocardioides sp. SYSU D00038]|uniref:hypothetical protein n=1 Tax=Nocardioides sp. SYSU D00038 TaxID=2812554 RepID=UPI0019681781|nr:hypothetical protein [Nocardioides sp. SYSU D00038]